MILELLHIPFNIRFVEGSFLIKNRHITCHCFYWGSLTFEIQNSRKHRMAYYNQLHVFKEIKLASSQEPSLLKILIQAYFYLYLKLTVYTFLSEKYDPTTKGRTKKWKDILVMKIWGSFKEPAIYIFKYLLQHTALSSFERRFGNSSEHKLLEICLEKDALDIKQTKRLLWWTPFILMIIA